MTANRGAVPTNRAVAGSTPDRTGATSAPGGAATPSPHGRTTLALWRYVRGGDWTVVFGYALFIGMMATGYYYNVTLVQLGLVDLGTRVIGLGEATVAADMALLALATGALAVGFGLWMSRRGWGARFFLKLRLAFGVMVLQLALTAALPFVRSEATYVGWILLTSLALGVGVPTTFSLAVDLIHRRDRGYVAAAITAAAYLAAALLSPPWTVEHFTQQMLLVMLPGVPVIGLLAFRPMPVTARLARQHEDPHFAVGRFVHLEPDGRTWVDRRLLVALVALFAIYFLDSLGFLRIVATPALVETAWQSGDMTILAGIGVAHLLGAAIAGVLYGALDEKLLFLWILVVFALVHLSYVLHARVTPEVAAALGTPMLYALAVSMYTVVAFAVWPDLSTPRTIGLHAALGVALSGWTATFISTALAVRWQLSGLSVEGHLDRVAALALLAFVALVGLALLETWGVTRLVGARLGRTPEDTT